MEHYSLQVSYNGDEGSSNMKKQVNFKIISEIWSGNFEQMKWHIFSLANDSLISTFVDA